MTTLRGSLGVFFVGLMAAAPFGTLGHAAPLTLVAERRSDYVITVSSSSTKLTAYAAEELGHYLKESTGAELPVRTIDIPGFFVALNKPGSPVKPIAASELKGLGDDGFVIRRQADSVVIGANAGRGLLYGVYAFLEDRLGVRWYSSTVTKVPSHPTLKVDRIDDRQSPVITWREVFYYDAYDPKFAGRLRLNGNAGSVGMRGPRAVVTREAHSGWGAWCHSIYNFVAPSLFATHPEYFSLINGVRVDPAAKENQVCFSNPAIIPLVIDGLRRRIDKPVEGLPIWAEEFSSPLYWSISQMDNNERCQCATCAALDKKHGSPIGSILPVINAVAKEFPDKKIATLAYAYSRPAPKGVRLEPNVAIQLCSIEPPRKAIERPIATAPEHKSFREDIVTWGKLTDDIVIWDYQVQFQDLVNPFPNFRSMQPNLKFYADHGVRGVFCQGNRDKGGEFAELRAYVLAKLLWNPTGNTDAYVNDFLGGYYGAAAQPIRAYFDLMHNELHRSKIPLSMDQGPAVHAKGYLSRENVMRYEKLFDRAEAAVKDSPELLDRVREARLPVWYARIQLGYGTKAELTALLERFRAEAARTGLWMLSEVDWRKDQSGNLDMWTKAVESRLHP